MLRAILALGFLFGAGGVSAQTLTPAQISAMIDQRMNDISPYRALIEDPDPARSAAAMEIMLESGDPDLMRMAREYGLLAPDPVIQKAALSGHLGSKPVLTMVLDGRKSSGLFPHWIQNLQGTLTPEGMAYVRFDVGDYQNGAKCFTEARRSDACFLTINAEGIFIRFDHPSYGGGASASGIMRIDEEGRLTGVVSMYDVPEAVPATIRLLD